MPGHNEHGGGCSRLCCGCICCIPSNKPKVPFCRIFLALLAETTSHFVRSVIILITTVLINISWFDLNFVKISNTVFAYSLCLLFCSFITFIKPKGFVNKKYRRALGQEWLQQTQFFPDGQRPPQLARQQTRVTQQRQRRGVRHDVEQVQADVRECRQEQVAVVEVHRAEESSESSNLVEPASSSSDEPLQQQATNSDSGSNFIRSSTDPTTQSTRSTPLGENTNGESQNDEQLQ